MTLLEFFSEVKDPRRKQGTRYQLKYVLLFCVLAVLSGATGYATMALWMKMKQKELQKTFNLKWVKMPGKTCISELFMSLDKAEVEKSFRAYSFDLANSKLTATRGLKTANPNPATKPFKSFQIAVDGKTLKGSYDNLVDTDAMNLISIFLVEKGLVLAHLGVENKESEMVGVRKLLEQEELINSLKLTGIKVISLDALHCQKKP
jgi:predicted transposase YbfD/YdcC